MRNSVFSQFFAMRGKEKLIQSKISLLDPAAYSKNVSEACLVLSYSQDVFYTAKKA